MPNLYNYLTYIEKVLEIICRMQILDCENEVIKFHNIHEKLMLDKLCEGIDNI